MKYLAFMACLLVGALGLSAESKVPSIEIKTESQNLDGKASLALRCNVRNATVFLNKLYQGTLPRDINGLVPGNYLVVISADGYFDQNLEISLGANTKTTVTVELIQKTGYLNISANAKDAIVVLGRQVYATGLIQLPAGLQTLTVKAFGYEERSFEVLVPLNLIHQVEVTLEPASFRTTTPQISRTAFNPRNAGMLGSVGLSYEVSTAGQAEYLVFDDSGRLVHKEESRLFDTWDQNWFWSGRDSGGHPLPDGWYNMQAIIQSAADAPGEPKLYRFDYDIRIDSSMLVLPQGMSGAVPGPGLGYSSFLPASSSLYWGGGFVLQFAGTVFENIQANMRAGLSLKDSLDFGILMQVGSEEGRFIFGSTIRTGLKPLGWFSPGAALSLRLPADTQYEPLTVRLALPLALGSRFISLNLSPELAAHYSSYFYWTGSASLSLNLATYSFGVQVSSRLSSTALGQSPLRLSQTVPIALDINFMPARFPLRASLGGLLELEAGKARWQTGVYFEVDAF